MNGVDDVFDAMRRDVAREVPGLLAEATEAEEETWDTAGLQRDFKVLSFAAPFVVVERKSDGVLGTLMFRHAPRVYFGFEPA